mmetsp:Transcript_82851/g.208697  ORF Transcript_82851/g.208697 Transcript_82851/m.208697 type:complete len:685 (-) Transcript_82851:82-2136(-)
MGAGAGKNGARYAAKSLPQETTSPHALSCSSCSPGELGEAKASRREQRVPTVSSDDDSMVPCRTIDSSLTKSEGMTASQSQSSAKKPLRLHMSEKLMNLWTKTEELREFQPHADFLRIMASPSTKLDAYVNTIMEEVLRLVQADRCSVYFVDEIRREVWCVGSSDCEPFSMPWDRGIVGLCARDASLVNVPDPRSHSSFDATIELKTGYRVHNMLTVPIRHMVDERRAVGVIQVLNKKGHELDGFSTHDEHELAKVAMVISDSFYRQRWRALESSAWQNTEALALIAAHAQDVTTKRSKETVSSPVVSLQDFRAPLERFVWRKFSAFALSDDDWREAKESTTSEGTTSPSDDGATKRSIQQLRLLDFHPFSYEVDELVRFVPMIMEDTRCVDRCRVSPERLRNWAWASQRHYRDNPYHNWFHGFSVFQHCYHQLVVALVQRSKPRYLDVFGLLIAALCHDFDHPGFTNSFLVEVEDELAIRYNDMSVLENHHANLACDLMRKDETGIGAALDRSELQALRRIIIRCILDTDMTRHSEQCQKCAVQVSKAHDEEQGTAEDRLFWLSMCIHTADLSGQVMPWATALEWESRVSQEFLRQASHEMERGISPAPFMQFSFEDMKQRGTLQRNFIDYVLVPLWDPYTQLMPALRPCFTNLLSNRAMFDYRSVHGTNPPAEEGMGPVHVT